MVSQQLQLEGPNLESLLDRVRDEYGPDARIVRAEKVRTGGVAGFFSRETFAISIELADAPASGAAPHIAPTSHPVAANSAVPAGGMTSVLALAEARNAEEARHTPPGVGNVSVPGMRRQPAHAAVFPASAAPAPLSGDVPAGSPAHAARPSSAPAHAAEPLPQPPAVPPAAHADVVRAHADHAGPVLAGTSDRAMAFADVLRAAAGEGVPSLQGPWPASSATASSATASSATVQHAEAATGSAVGTPPISAAGQLRGLGLPEAFLPPDRMRDVYGYLLGALAVLPQAPSLHASPGTTVALVGELSATLALAERLAASGQLVVLVSGVPAASVSPRIRWVPSAEAAWALRAESDGPAMYVVVNCAPGSGTGNAREVLGALAPDVTCGVLSAVTKVGDVGRWARELELATLAVYDTAATADPAAILSLDLPVSRVDDREAGPAAWAGLLTSRMSR